MEDKILKQALAPGPDCLSVEDIGRYADGALGAEERSAAARHIEKCQTCQAELALMRSVTSLSKRSESKRPNIFQMAAAAAAVLIVVGAGSYYFLNPRAPALPSAVTTGREVTRSLALSVRSPVGDQREAPQRFEWVASDPTVRYRVRLFEVDRREIWSTSTTASVVEVPSTVQALLSPGRAFLWDVTAYDAADRIISESGTQSFRVISR